MRRRGFGSLFRRQPQPQTEQPGISPALQRAHQMLALGDYARAATTFEQLGHAAEMRAGPRAPFLFLQAGRARILQGQISAGMAHFKYGLELLAKAGRYNQLYRAGQRLMQELKLRGLEKEASEIGALIGASVPAIADMPTERGPDTATVILPTHCAACGGPIRSTEVEWLDARTAECPYCGSPVRAQ
jgi:hypothetical protein